MKLRLMGTRAEVAAAVARLPEVFDVLEVSDPKENRGTSSLVRVYVEAALRDARETDR